MRFSLLASLMILMCLPAQAQSPRAEYKCLLIYSLRSPSHTYFSQQVEQLKTQLLQQDIALMDLNSWYTEAPYLALSGRQKSLLRQAYNLPAQDTGAVLLDNKGQIIVRYQGTVDLVNLMLACHQGH